MSEQPNFNYSYSARFLDSEGHPVERKDLQPETTYALEVHVAPEGLETGEIDPFWWAFSVWVYGFEDIVIDENKHFGERGKLKNLMFMVKTGKRVNHAEPTLDISLWRRDPKVDAVADRRVGIMHL